MEMTNEKAQEILQALWASKYPDYSEGEIREALMKGMKAVRLLSKDVDGTLAEAWDFIYSATAEDGVTPEEANGMIKLLGFFLHKFHGQKKPEWVENVERKIKFKTAETFRMQPIKDGFPETDSVRYLVQDSNGNVWSAEYDENQEDPAERFGEWIQMFDPHTLGVIDIEWRAYDDIVAWCELPELYEGEETSQARKYKEIGEALSAGIQAGLEEGMQEAAGEKEPETILTQVKKVKTRFNLICSQFFFILAEHYLERAEDNAAKLEKLREEAR